MAEKKGSGIGFLRGLVLGALASAGLYYFLNSTEEGKKVKKKIKKRGEDVLENLGGVVEDLEKKGTELTKKAKKVTSEVTEDVEKSLAKIKKGRSFNFFTRKGSQVKKTPSAK